MDLWWVSIMWSTEWSDEETSARTRILTLSTAVFFLIYIPAMIVVRAFGMDRNTSAVAGFCVISAPALYAGRWMSERLWPDLVNKADANAAKRIGKR